MTSSIFLAILVGLYRWSKLRQVRLRSRLRLNSISLPSFPVGPIGITANLQMNNQVSKSTVRTVDDCEQRREFPLVGEKGMVIVEAKNEEEARLLFASDLMVQKKTFTLELHQFRPFYKGTIE